MKAYAMCSPQECDFRQRSNEVSLFEATHATAHQPPSKRRMDPCKAIKKYRRSAAGTSKDDQYPVRTIDQLFQTLDYLTNLFVQQWPTYQRSTPQQNQARQHSTNVDLVNFLEDRIRAIQVDLVVSQSASKKLQYRLVKLHIVLLYLMLDEPIYARQHGISALHTALSSYWNENPDKEMNEMDDGILAFSALVKLNEYLGHVEKTDPDTPCTFGASIMATYRKQFSHTDTRQRSLPLFQWSLQLVVACNNGEWFTALQLLYHCETNFGMLASCCMAPSLGRIRAKCLQAYNIAFMKGERIVNSEIARLLVMMDGASAGTLCAKLNLPVDEADDDDGQGVVTFKVAPMEMDVSGPKRDDWFVMRGKNDWSSDFLNTLLS